LHFNQKECSKLVSQTMLRTLKREQK